MSGYNLNPECSPDNGIHADIARRAAAEGAAAERDRILAELTERAEMMESCRDDEQMIYGLRSAIRYVARRSASPARPGLADEYNGERIGPASPAASTREDAHDRN